MGEVSAREEGARLRLLPTRWAEDQTLGSSDNPTRIQRLHNVPSHRQRSCFKWNFIRPLSTEGQWRFRTSMKFDSRANAELHNPDNSWESWENHLLTHQPRHWERKSRLITYIHEIFYSTVFSSVLKTLLGLSYLRKWFDCSLQESTSPNPSNSSLESKNLCPWILWIPCLKIFPFLFLPILDLLANLKFPHWKCRFKPNFQSSINSGLTSSPSPLPDAAKALRGGM